VLQVYLNCSTFEAQLCPHLLLQRVDDMVLSWYTADGGDIADPQAGAVVAA